MRNVLNVITHNKCDIMHGVKHVLNYNLHLLFTVLMKWEWDFETSVEWLSKMHIYS